jgi:hypothetical protein
VPFQSGPGTSGCQSRGEDVSFVSCACRPFRFDCILVFIRVALRLLSDPAVLRKCKSALRKGAWGKRDPIFDGLPSGNSMGYTLCREDIPDSVFLGQDPPAKLAVFSDR